jgi:hypothetical protein
LVAKLTLPSSARVAAVRCRTAFITVLLTIDPSVNA